MTTRTLLSLFALTITCLTGHAVAQDADPPATQPSAEDEAKVAYILMETTMGDIYLELNREKAPITVKNFLSYVEKEYYDGTIFHRVIENFMIQGGGFTKDMTEKKKTDDPIENEWENGLKNERGTIAMARLGRRPDSATSQFFINVKDNPFLDEPRDGAGYAVFGKVVAGMDVIDKIKEVETTRAGRHQNVPAEPIVIEKARKIKPEEAKKAIEEEKSRKQKEAAGEAHGDGDDGGDRASDGI